MARSDAVEASVHLAVVSSGSDDCRTTTGMFPEVESVRWIWKEIASGNMHLVIAIGLCLLVHIVAMHSLVFWLVNAIRPIGIDRIGYAEYNVKSRTLFPLNF